MAKFGCVAELAAFLGKLHPDFAQHAPALWQKWSITPQQLANLSEPHYFACGVPEGHIADIKTRAGYAGEQSAYSNVSQHHCPIAKLFNTQQSSKPCSRWVDVYNVPFHSKCL